MNLALNKVVIVTGASSGIGAATAIKFTSEGAKVAIVGRDAKKLEIITEKCIKSGGKPLVINADVSKDDDARRIIDSTVKHFGKLDVLVNNAAIAGGTTGLLRKEPMNWYDKVIATNLRGAIHLACLAASHLVETKGNIINISSIAAKIPVSVNFPYCTSKAGLDQFMKCAAFELGSKGVRVNNVTPGPVRTDIIENMGKIEKQNSMFENMKKTTVLNRLSDPEEVADLVLFLSSEKAKGITGACYPIDNGALAKGSR